MSDTFACGQRGAVGARVNNGYCNHFFAFGAGDRYAYKRASRGLRAMSDALRAVGIAVIATFCTLLLREAGFRGAKLAAVSAMVGIFSFALILSGRIIALLGMDGLSESGEGVLRSFIKIIGIGYIYGIGSDICRELGEGGIASALLVVGRVEILLVCLPAFLEVFNVGLGYLK